MEAQTINSQVRRIERLARMLTRNDKLKIFAGEGWSSRRRPPTIVFPPAELDFKSDMEILGLILHEIGHQKFTTEPDFKKSYTNEQRAIHNLVNCTEDLRIKELLKKEYRNADYYISKAEASYPIPEDLQFLPEEIQFGLGIYKREANEPMKVDLKVKNLLNKHLNLANDVKQLKSTEKLGEYLEENIIDDYLKLIPPKDRQERENKSNSEAKAKLPATFDLNEEINQIPKLPYPKQKYRQLMSRNSSGKIEHLKEVLKTILPDLVNKKSLPPTRVDHAPISDHDYQHYVNEIKPIFHELKRRIGTIFEKDKFEKMTGNFRSGRALIFPKLYRHRINDFRLFHKKIGLENAKRRVVLVVDQSGSMVGSKIYNATKATILLAQVLDFYRIPFTILGFNDVTHVYKSFYTSTNKVREDLANLTELGRDYDGNSVFNCDGYALKEAEKILDKELDSQGIIIALSDGSPVNCSKHSLSLKTVVEEIEKKYVVFGIGIESSSVQEYYKDYSVVNDIKDLPETLVKNLKKAIYEKEVR